MLVILEGDTVDADAEALVFIADYLNNPPVVEAEATAEERIAAALEYQNLESM